MNDSRSTLLADNDSRLPLESMSADDLDAEVDALLRTNDHRYTSGRRQLIAAIRGGDRPLTITQIAADAELPQSTVYRNLTILEEVGAVTRIVASDEFSRYELAEHLTEHHHHHLICSNCGDVADFALDAETETMLTKALDRAAKDAGFSTDSHRLDLLGTCTNCS